MDIDVPRNGSKFTLLHWLYPNLVGQPNSTLTQDNLTAGASTAVGAAYIPPTPPGGSGPHRYTFLLFEQPENWAIPSEFVTINPPADSSARIGFNITEFISASGLDEPIAANYLRVLNGTAAETSSAESMTGTAAGAAATSGSMTGSMTESAAMTTSSSGVEATGSLVSSAIASRSGSLPAPSPTDGAVSVRSQGREMIAGLAMAVVGAGAWML